MLSRRNNKNRSKIKLDPMFFTMIVNIVMIQIYTLFSFRDSSSTFCHGFSSISNTRLLIPFPSHQYDIKPSSSLNGNILYSISNLSLRRRAQLVLKGGNNSNDGDDKKKKKNSSDDKKKKKKNTKKESMNNNSKQIQNSKNSNNSKKTNQKNKTSKPKPPKNSKNIINLLSNPYEAGVQFRQTIDRTLKLGINKPLTSEQKSIYYLDDRFLDSESTGTSGGGSSSNTISEGALAFVERNRDSFGDEFGSSFDMLYEDDDYIPEVLVIGATSAIGRTVVKRLLLSNRFKVRVLVHNLYSKTLNMLGTGVTYCQGELYDMESLEYALTDVDKIVFCESPPQKDELDYQKKFDQFVQDTLTESANEQNNSGSSGSDNDDDEKETKSSSTIDQKELEIQQLSELMEMKAEIAKQVDCTGMQNVLRAYQNVRHADYGTPQAAKRSLFKFQSREEDFGLFSIHFDEEEEEMEDMIDSIDHSNGIDGYRSGGVNNYEYGDKYEYDMNNDNYDASDDIYEQTGYDEDYNTDQYQDYKTMEDNRSNLSKSKKASTTTSMKTQVNWMKNKFNHGVFVGRLPNSGNNQQGGSEASVISSRLRSREEPEKGIDLSNGFAGFVCRICADGKNYEAFIRTGEYEENGIEYVCKFQTNSKSNSGNRSSNKFATVRLPFSNFVPIVRRKQQGKRTQGVKSTFDGNDVRQMGFRINSIDNIVNQKSTNLALQGKKGNDSKWISFYLALCYIKVFRMQPEPEFIYLSDARLGNVRNGMVNHELKRVILSRKDGENIESNMGNDDGATTIFDENEAKRVITNRNDRSDQELYYKYCGEEMLKHSGLSYSIIRLPELNELASGEFSTLKLKQSNDSLTTVSRAEVAAVCESALLDPNARNICFYMTKTNPGDKAIAIEPNISSQFLELKPDTSN